MDVRVKINNNIKAQVLVQEGMKLNEHGAIIAMADMLENTAQGTNYNKQFKTELEETAAMLKKLARFY